MTKKKQFVADLCLFQIEDATYTAAGEHSSTVIHSSDHSKHKVRSGEGFAICVCVTEKDYNINFLHAVFILYYSLYNSLY